MKISLELRNLLARVIPWRLRKIFPERIFRHFYVKGTFTARYYGVPWFKLYSSGAQVENEIYWRGIENSHERLSVKFWIQLCEILNPQVVWDIGANTGIYGLLAKRLVPECKVFLFEPLSVPIKIAKMNFSNNALSANFHHLALGNFSGSGKVFLETEIDFAYSVTVNKNLSHKSFMRELIIQVEEAILFIDDPLKDIPDLIKMDVETFEPEVLEGFRDLNLAKTAFIIEILSDSIAEKIEDRLPPSEFLYFNIDEKSESCRFQEHLTKSDSYNFLILPKNTDWEKIQRIREFIAKYEKAF